MKMRAPSFVSRLFKRKKPKSEKAAVDKYERAIVESPPTPPEVEGDVLVANLAQKCEDSWRFINRPRATPHLMTDISWDSNRAHYGGNGSIHGGKGSSGDVSDEWPLGGRNHRRPLASPTRPPSSPQLVPTSTSPMPPLRKTDKANTQATATSTSSSSGVESEFDHACAYPPPHPNRGETNIFNYGYNLEATGRLEEDLKLSVESQSSFDVPLSWESLEELESMASLQLDGVDDLAIARRVEEMALPPPAVISAKQQASVSWTTSKPDALPAHPPLVPEPSGSSSFAPISAAPAVDATPLINANDGYLPPASHEGSADDEELADPASFLHTPTVSPGLALETQTPRRARPGSSIYLVTPSGSNSSSGSPVHNLPLTPPNSRPSSGIHSPDRLTLFAPPSPRSPLGSPLARNRPLPLTPTEKGGRPTSLTLGGFSSYVGQSESGARADLAAYPTPNSSLGKK